jgi:hypothetical protein
MNRAILAAALALSVLPANAANSKPIIAIQSGSDLNRLCEADRKSANYAMCYSFNAAVLEIVENNSIYGLKVCVPPLVNVNKAVDLPARWLRNHPDHSIQPASQIAAEAYAAAFPCKIHD